MAGNGVQRVETDRTPIGVVDRIRQQVVGIDEHGRYHDHRRIAPAGAVEREGDQQRDDEVQGDVDHVGRPQRLNALVRRGNVTL